MSVTPILPRPGILPNRVTPRLVPRLRNYATRVRVHIPEYTATRPDGTEYTVPATDCVPKLLSNTVDPQGNFHEYYMFMRDGDPEAVMDLYLGPTVAEGIILCEVSRLTRNAMDVYLDEALIVSFSTVDRPGPWVGFIDFDISIE